MELTVFVMVIAAALLHAVWNAVVKIQGDRLVVMAIVTGSSGLISLLALPFVAFPSLESWPYIGLSLVLHNAYYLFLIASYRLGDFSHVYPIARGVSPLIVTLIRDLAREPGGGGGRGSHSLRRHPKPASRHVRARWRAVHGNQQPPELALRLDAGLRGSSAIRSRGRGRA